MKKKTFISLIFIIFTFTRLRTYEESVNTNSADNSIGEPRHASLRMEKKKCSISMTFTCAISNLMFNSGEFCDSATDHNRVKESDRNQCL